MLSKRRRRALAALTMLAAMGSGTAEAAAGELADANEHYEDARSLVHEHSGSELSVGCVTEADQDSDDQHVKAFDHCSHTHGSSVRGATLPSTTVHIVPVPEFVDEIAHPADAPPTELFHPPKA